MSARVEIPRELAAQLLFDADRTCCICNDRGKQLQIHHIDGNHSNSLDPENLAVLCLECHGLTMLRGGFGRQLEAEQVKLYKKKWEARVRKRRDQADALAVQAVIGKPLSTSDRAIQPDASRQDKLPDQKRLVNYLRSLPAIKRDAYARARPMWDQGNFAAQRAGASDVTDVYEQILITLCSYYPPGHFSQISVQDYISSHIASRYRWHRARWEPLGAGTRGTIIRVIVAGEVMADLESMISELVTNLLEYCDEDAFGPSGRIDVKQWQVTWARAGEDEKTDS